MFLLLVSAFLSLAADEPQLTPSAQHENALPAHPNLWSEKATQKKLRQLAEQWSRDWMKRPPMTKEELLNQVPPKFHPMIKEYFEKLEKMQKENDKKNDKM